MTDHLIPSSTTNIFRIGIADGTKRADLVALLLVGRERGFLTPDDVLSVLGSAELTPVLIESLMGAIRSEGIEWHDDVDDDDIVDGFDEVDGVELTFDQLLFNRPIPGYAQYRAPVRGMYMCGSSTHPGGGVMGAPGANAAGAILRDLGRAH